MSDSQARQILFMTPQLPYPPEQGAAIRNYNLIRQMARRHRVDLLTFAPPGVAIPQALYETCRRVVAIPAPTRTRAMRLRTLLLSRMPDMACRLDSAEMRRALTLMLEETTYDVVQVEGIEMAPYGLMVRQGSGGKKPAVLYDAHNAEALLQRRAMVTDAGRPSRWPAALYSLVQANRLGRFERLVCRAAAAVVAVSDADAAVLRRSARVPHVVPIPNGVDVDEYHPGLADSLPLRHPAIVFTGKMDFRPNIDGMLWFFRRVWPRVRTALPDAFLYVVGKSPSPALDPLRAEGHIVVTGYVEDIKPYFGGADVYIVPLRIGGGTRLKVLEAMSAGLPIVTTRLGCEGIDVHDGQHAILADSAEAFAEAVVKLARDRQVAGLLGRAARALAEERYDWVALAPALEAVYDDIAPITRS